jgi:acyl transferase domain-containing protein
VEFEATTRKLLDQRHTLFVEISPHPVLTPGIQECAEVADVDAVVIPTLRRDEEGPRCFLTSAAEACGSGAEVDWTAAFVATGARKIDLPTYPFQRKRFWLRGTGRVDHDPASVGLAAADHPLLGAVVPVAESGALVLTGRLSTDAHRWLEDHVVAAAVLVPGSVLVECTTRAATEVGYDHLDEFTVETPLVLPERGGVSVQVSVSPEDADGRRGVAVHSRPDGEAPWIRNAGGTLSRIGPEPVWEVTEWPPAGAREMSLQGFYENLAERGVTYGPTFRGVRAVWRCDDEVFAEVALPQPQRFAADRFHLHPALLDAALQVAGIGEHVGGPRVAFAWSGVSLRKCRTTELRVRVSPVSPDLVSVAAAEPDGTPVLGVSALLLRTVSVEQVGDAAARARSTATPEPANGNDPPLVRRVEGLSGAERHQLVLREVRAHVAHVLGHDSVVDIDLDRPFRDLGVDSTAAVQLRNRLSAATGLRLPVVLLFRHPTTTELARSLADELGARQPVRPKVLDELDRFQRCLADAQPDVRTRAEIVRTLEAVLRGHRHDPSPRELDGDAVASATADEMFELIDRVLDRS